MKNLSVIFPLIFSTFALLNSCSSNQIENAEKKILNISTEANRNMSSGKSKALKFISLASFEKGALEGNMTVEDLESLDEKSISLVVFYDSEVEWAKVFNSGVYEKTGDESFNKLLYKFNLVITEQQEFDDLSEFLVLEANTKLEDPITAAKDISKIKGVIMVHLKEIPKETNKTAENELIFK
jgi:hypothetical protein